MLLLNAPPLPPLLPACCPTQDLLLDFAVREMGAVVSIQAEPQIATTFEMWLESGEGQEVLYRIQNNHHNVPLPSVAAYFDTAEDVQQKALIWLWQEWERDPCFSRFVQGVACPSHRAGTLTKIAVQRARCRYAKRRLEKREQQCDLLDVDGEPQRFRVLYPPSHATDIEPYNLLSKERDKKMDVQSAIEIVVLRVIEGHPKFTKRFHPTLLEHITRTIIEGHMYHYTDRYSQTGTFRKFCEARGITRNQIARWRPLIFQYLREELSAYQPVQVYLQ